MIKIACAGDNCVDYYDNTGESFPGGNPVNVSVYVRRLGGQSAYLGAVGTDDFGKQMCAALQEKGVDVSHVQILPGKTAFSHVERINGERVFGDYDEGVMADFRFRQADFDFLKGYNLLVTGLWGHTESQLADVRAMGIPVAFDGAERPLDEAGRIALPHVNVAFFSDDASDEESLKARILEVAALGPQIVVATRGGKGSLAYDGESFYPGQIVPCSVVDTMGAGDSFIAGFLMAWLKKESIPACMRAGKCSRNAGLSRRVVIIKERINMEELLKSLQELLAIESVARWDQEKPFGNGVAQALDYTLSLCQRMGFHTKNADGLYGYAEIGEGAEIIGWPSGRCPRGRWLALSALCRNHRRRTAVRPRHNRRQGAHPDRAFRGP